MYKRQPEDLAEPVAFFSVDVSFISLKHIVPVADAICTPDAVGVCLVKPQFEAGREKVGKKGVVRDPATHREVLKMAEGYAMANHFTPAGLDFSPIKGPEGNIEYLMYVQHCDAPQPLPEGLDVYKRQPLRRYFERFKGETGMSKIRLDQYLCQNGLVQSREMCIRDRTCRTSLAVAGRW